MSLVTDPIPTPAGTRRRRSPRCAGIVKRYDRVVALAGVDLTFARGEVHAVVGENGAGKTTLMQILAGVQQPDAGTHPRPGPRGQRRRRRGGLPPGHRDGAPALHAVPVAHGGREPHARPRAAARAGCSTPPRPSGRSPSSGDRYGLRVDPRKRIDELSVGRPPAGRDPARALPRRRAAHPRRADGGAHAPGGRRPVPRRPRAARRRARPRSSSATSSTRCCAIAERDHGPPRRARHRRRARRPRPTPAELARLMVGRELAAAARARAGRARPAACCAWTRLRGPGIRDVDLDVHERRDRGRRRGGRQRPDRARRADRRPAAGQRPAPITIARPGHDERHGRRRGETRASPTSRTTASSAGWRPTPRSRDNLIMGAHRAPPLARRGRLDGRAANRLGAELVAPVRGQGREPRRPGAVALGRQRAATRHRARARPAARPSSSSRSRRAASTSRRPASSTSELLARRAAGAAILLISADLTEILALSDRIVVLYAGAIVGEMPVADAEPERLGLLMAGITAPAASRRPMAEARRRPARPAGRAPQPEPAPSRAGGRRASGPRARAGWRGSLVPLVAIAPRARGRRDRDRAAGGSVVDGVPGADRRAPSARPRNLSATLARAVPDRRSSGVGLALAFRAGCFNLGGRGPDDRERGRHRGRRDHVPGGCPDRS